MTMPWAVSYTHLMKHLDGMETARRIRERDGGVLIVFITNMAQYAIRGYAVGALAYVWKASARFREPIQIALHRFCLLYTSLTGRAETKVGVSDPVVCEWKCHRSTDKSYPGDNRLISPKSCLLYTSHDL